MATQKEVADKLRKLADKFESHTSEAVNSCNTFKIYKLIIDGRLNQETWAPVFSFEEE